MELQGQTAVVTGGSRGIGRAVSLALAGEGADVAVNYNREKGKAEEVCKEMRAMGRDAFPFSADVSDQAQADALIQEAIKRWGRVDILINNAGISPGGGMASVTQFSLEEWHKVLDVNLNGPLYTMRAVLPHMRERRTGKIVNISSNITRRLPPRSANYTVSKAALEALTVIVSKEEARNGIRVNCICPGLIETDMADAAFNRMSEAERRAFLDAIPMGRIGQPQEIGEVVAFLVSERASYITGQVIAVNGGERG